MCASESCSSKGAAVGVTSVNDLHVLDVTDSEVVVIRSLRPFIKSNLECRELGLRPGQGWLKFPGQLRICREGGDLGGG